MPRDRKAIEARKKRERQQEHKEEVSKYNAYGFSDPTAYQAIRAITREERKKK